MFEEVKHINLKPQRDEATGVNAFLFKIGSGKAKLKISLTHEVMVEIGFKPDDRLKVMVGTGEHTGLIRLIADSAGPARFQVHKMVGGSFRYYVSLGHIPQLADVVVQSRPCTFEQSHRIIEITLPKVMNKVQTRNGTSEPESELQKQNREAQERRQRMGMKS